MENNIHLLITAADHIKNTDKILRRERYIEYMLSLHRAFSYNLPSFAVISEFKTYTENSPPLLNFPFKHIEYIKIGEFQFPEQGQHEMAAIQRLLIYLDNRINDNDFIIKLSGRYCIINNEFIEKVKENKDNLDVDGVLKSDGKGMYFCLFALRYKILKEFIFQSPSIITKSIEYVMFDWLKSRGIFERCINISSLGVLQNVSNNGTFTLT
jgi:hypothetical protein